MTLSTSHLLSISHLTLDDVVLVLKTAQHFKRQTRITPSLKDKTVINCFFENSTRTRISFERAAQQLGAHVITFNESCSSASKGESIRDTILNLRAMGPAAFVIRHAHAGIPQLIAETVPDCPIINAGDGAHAHPTQALLDALTIQEAKGSLKGLHVGIIGDIAHSRVARSNMRLLKMLGAHVTVCGPKTLMPVGIADFGVKVSRNFKQLLPTLDVIMMLRIQLERAAGSAIPSLADYSLSFGLTDTLLQHAKTDAIIMHPGPINRGVELSASVADGLQSVILKQVENGIYVRMAVLDLLWGGRS